MLSVLLYLLSVCLCANVSFRNHVPFFLRGMFPFQIAQVAPATLIVLTVFGPINLSITLNLRTYCQKKKKNHVTIVISCLDIADFL